MLPVTQAAIAPELAQWPMILNTGRYRDQWHTMTRTGLSPRLARHREEPLVEVHPSDAARLSLADGDIARVATAQGESLFRVQLSDGQRVGEVFTPIHWTDRQSSGGRSGLLPRPLADPHSGQPGFKSTPVRVEKVAIEWRGFLLVRDALQVPPNCLWHTKITVPGGSLYELAGIGQPAALDACLPKGDRIEARDAGRGSWRAAVLQNGRLAASLFVTRSGELPTRDWLIRQLGEMQSGPAILAGRAPGAANDKGAIVCVCFDVGMRTIVAAIAEQDLVDVAGIGRALQAGTNCGSCRPALAALLTAKETRHAS
jgi:assimilatory nitrate reductase catalytic subunit